jgi:8-oxo-dGTP pyrophosphatase MutT (NUDIX family)
VTAGELLAPGHPALTASTDLGVARSQIRAAASLTGEAARHRDRVLAFIDRHPDAARRSCLPGHLTGSALVVDAEGRTTLVVLHRKLGRWFQPGGHADGDTNLAAVALREAVEETGIADLVVHPVPIDVDVHRVAPPGEEPHLHLDVRFLVVAAAGARAHHNHESLAARWVGPDDLDDLRPPIDPSTRRLVTVGLAAARRGA